MRSFRLHWNPTNCVIAFNIQGRVSGVYKDAKRSGESRGERCRDNGLCFVGGGEENAVLSKSKVF